MKKERDGDEKKIIVNHEFSLCQTSIPCMINKKCFSLWWKGTEFDHAGFV